MQSLLPTDRWTRLETLFEACIDLPQDQREAFLDEHCHDDPQLREELLCLLRHDTAGNPEDPALLDAIHAGAASVFAGDPPAGQMLGPYRIEREIGRGGMAVVYLAVRADGEFQKRVAVKLIKRGMDTDSVIARLRRERRILAAMEHPSIARLLDGGTTPDGRPWIAMEFIEGLPIDRFCEENRLTVEERCLLIARVCDTVAYAHRHLVVHRDLKPTNILITPDGNPKVLDFGIAKLLGEDEWTGKSR